MPSTPRTLRQTEQVVAHQPAISISISFQHPLNRAGGRTSNVGPPNFNDLAYSNPGASDGDVGPTAT